VLQLLEECRDIQIDEVIFSTNTRAHSIRDESMLNLPRYTDTSSHRKREINCKRKEKQKTKKRLKRIKRKK
jgi:phage head maturation protease